MKTISQVAKLTGVSIRTLQYYDEIGLLKPSELTPAGYRLYDEHALQTLQQILFFRELDFPLKDIIKIMQNPDFDRISAFKKQKELLLLKRNRTDRLIQLLERLEKGEECMSFKEFDLSEYIHALEDFKVNQTDTIIKHWGSIDNFDMFIQKIKDDEENVVAKECTSATIFAGENRILKQRILVENPKLWSAENPKLYTFETKVYENTEAKELLDEAVDTFGIRILAVDAKRGFRVNGKSVNLRGGCIHHDSGLLGAATYEDAQYRQILKMKEAGLVHLPL